MNKLIVTCAMGMGASMISTDSIAQLNARVGLKAGGSNIFSTTEFTGLKKTFTEHNSNFGFYAGGLVEISGKNKSSKLKGQVEVLYSYNKFDLIDASVKNNMISIPIQATYFFTPKFSVGLGPSVNFNGDKWSYHNDGSSRFSGLKNVQIGALIDVSYYLYKGLFVQARYNYYFGNATEGERSSIKYSGIQAGVGFKFR